MDNGGQGYIKVRTTAIGGSTPVGGAKVVISEYGAAGAGEDEVLYTLVTDSNGSTEIVPLFTPRISESLTPGAEQPYSVYALRVTKDGYYPVELAAVPIFDRVTSLQSVDLIPLGAGNISVDENDGEVVIYETPSGGYPEERGSQNGVRGSGRRRLGGMNEQ